MTTRAQRRAAIVSQQIAATAAQMENRQFAAMYQSAVARAMKGDTVLFDFISQLERAPVGIEEFLDGKEFFGATDLNIWPEVRRAIIEINQNWWKGPGIAYDEAILAGATGTGKSTIVITSMAYHTYLLSCIKKPQAVYGLPSATSIVLPIMGAKPQVVNKVIYAPLRKFIESMPYFQKHMMPNKLIDSEMYFADKNVRIVKAGGDEDAILGEAVIGGGIDEINFMNVVQKSKKAEVSTGRAGLYDQAQQVHNRMVTRKKGRFTYKGPLIGIVFASSSTRYRGDFTDKRMQFVKSQGIKTTYIYNKRQYDVVPAERFSGRTFRLLIGNEVMHDTRVLEDNEIVPPGCWIEDVPIEYYDDFKSDPYTQLRDVLGISNNQLSPFIKSRHKIYECVEMGKEQDLKSFLLKDHVILGADGMPQVALGHYCTNPGKARYVHVDLSQTGDRCIAQGQPVLMEDGRYKPIEHVEAGDFVVSQDGTSHEVVRRLDNGNKDVLEVDIYGWRGPLRATYNHQVLAVRRRAISYKNGQVIKPNDPMFTNRSGKAAKARYDYEPTYVNLGSLRPGDYLVTPRPEILQATMFEGTILNYQTGYIAGLYAAEGSMYVHHKRTYVQFALHGGEVLIAAQLREYLAEEFGVSTFVCTEKGSKGINLRVNASEELVEFLAKTVGEYSHRKRFALWATGNRQFHAGFCHGYTDGDAHVRYNEAGQPKGLKVKTVSAQLANDFYWCLVAYGFMPVKDSGPAYTSTYKGGEVSHRAWHAVAVTGVGQMEKFRFWREGPSNVTNSAMLGLDGYLLSPIVDIRSGGVTPVYDLTVADLSSYVVGNSVVHNCGVAMLRFDGMVRVGRSGGQDEFLPKATVEMACTIEPDANNEIDIAEVRSFVRMLKDKHGYPIKGVSYDGFDSRESIQAWRKGGMASRVISVDRTSVPYKQLRDAMYDRRIALPDDEDLVSEIIELEYDAVKDKIDHSVIGKKDLSDAVCGAYQNMLERRSTWDFLEDGGDPAMRGRAPESDRYEGPRR